MQPLNKGQSKSANTVWLACVVFSLLAGVTLLGLSFIPFQQLKPLMDALARDRSLDAFTINLYSRLVWVLRSVALLGLLGGALLLIKKPTFLQALKRAFHSSPKARVQADLKELRSSIAADLQDKVSISVLVAITLLAILIRLVYISRPMLHDEAYTFIAFASRSLWTVMSDYELPNNHIFHTILVYVAYHLLGNHPWVIRLPAFIAGVLCVPAAYLAGSLVYNRRIALIAASLVASAPILVEYSTNARGYTLICLFTLLVLASAVYVKDHRNWIAWAAIILFSSLGFYTIPIMLYPFGVIMLWLFLSAIFHDTPAYPGRSIIIYLIFTTAGVGALNAILYTPVFIQSGIQAVVANSFVRSLSYEALWESLGLRLATTWQQWLADLPVIAGYLSLIGFAASLVWHWKLSSQRVPLQVAAFLWISLGLLLQRVAPLARIWLFLLPLYLLWATAGFAGILSLLSPILPGKLAFGLVLLIAIALPATSLVIAEIRKPIDQESAGVEEDITQFLKDQLQPGDLVVIQAPMATQLLYYFRQYDLSTDYFDRGQANIRRAFVVVSSKYSQTLESVLQKKGLGGRFDLSQAEVVYHSRHVTIYEVTPLSTAFPGFESIVRRGRVQRPVLGWSYYLVDKRINCEN